MANKSFFFWVATLWLLLLLTSCGGGSSTNNPGNDTNNTGTPTTPPPTPPVDESVIQPILNNKILGFVSDINGNPVSYASLDGGDNTGPVGLFLTNQPPASGGWYTIRAQGYANAYAAPLKGLPDSRQLLNVIMTPVGASASFSTAATTDLILQVGNSTQPDLTVTFPVGAFATDVSIEATVLDPVNTGNYFAPLNTTDKLYINYPFDIRALAEDGTEIQMQTGKAATARLTDNGTMGTAPRLFRFEPDQGKWIEQLDAACIRVDASHIQCQLDHFSRYGIGAPSAPALPSGDSTNPTQLGNQSNYALWQAIQERFMDFMNGEYSDENQLLCDALNSPEAAKAARAEINVVMNNAESVLEQLQSNLENNNTSNKFTNTAKGAEMAKKHLLNLAAKYNLMGYSIDNPNEDACGAFSGGTGGSGQDGKYGSNPAYTALDAARQITDLLVENLLTLNTECPDIDAVKKAIAESGFLGTSSENTQKLIQEYLRLLNTCDIWEGRIEYTILLPDSTLPPPLDIAKRVSGPDQWTEFHRISLTRSNPLATEILSEGSDAYNTFEGEDMVTTRFAAVTYKNPDELSTIMCGFPVYRTDTLRGEPDPGEIVVSLSGSANRPDNFVPENVDASEAITSFLDVFEINYEVTGTDGVPTGCHQLPPNQVSMPSPYYGQIKARYDFDILFNDVETLWLPLTIDGSNLPTLWDILNQGPNSSLGGYEYGQYPREFYVGNEILNDAMIRGTVQEVTILMRWHIVHIDYTKRKN